MTPLMKAAAAFGALAIIAIAAPMAAALAPICTFTVDPASPLQGVAVTFDGTGSSDSDGTIVAWYWQFDDGQTAEGSVASHTYALAGSYTVSLRVTDDDNERTTCFRPVEVLARPDIEPTICFDSMEEPSSRYIDWNCSLRAYWGSIGGNPNDTCDIFGVLPGATDGYDRTLDSKKATPPMGDYVYIWFDRPTWGQGPIMHDWRSVVPEGTSKVWGTGIADTWNVKTNQDNGPSGVFDSCAGDLEFPVAASIYIAWEFGGGGSTPYVPPPADYEFTLQYRGGINPKPAGTALADASAPALNQTWDMDAVAHIVIPLWSVAFEPYNSECSGFAAGDTARFKIIVSNPDTAAQCSGIDVCPPSPQCQPAEFGFAAVASGDGPLTFYWDFGDGGSDTGNPAWHTYDGASTYTVSCTATDADGDTAQCSVTVDVVECVGPICSFTIEPSLLEVGQPVNFDGSASYDPDGAVVDWSWDFGDGGNASGEHVSYTYTEAGAYLVCLTVTDNGPVPSTANCCQTVLADVVEVSIPLTTEGWHMISLPLEPVNKSILLDRDTKQIDPESIFYQSYLAGNDPRHWPLARYQPGCCYWHYGWDDWYEIGVEPPPGKPHPGPWWQGFWFNVRVAHTITYRAYPLPAAPMVRQLDLSATSWGYAWMIVGACARAPEPYNPDVSTWPTTSMVTDMTWGKSTPPTPPMAWLPTSACGGPDAWHQGYIGLPLLGYCPRGYYSVSPSSGAYCGAPADTGGLTPGEGYWLDVKDTDIWLRLSAQSWP